MFSIKQYLRNFDPDTSNDEEWIVTCPVCNKKKLVVNVNKKLWHCWVCQEYRYNRFGKKVPIKGAGNLVSLVTLLSNIDKQTAKQFLKDSNESVFSDYQYTDGEYEETDLDPIEIPYPAYAKKITGMLPFLEKRGITLTDVQAFGLFYCDDGRYRNRLIFPVYEQGKLIFYQGRSMLDQVNGEYYVKSLNPPKYEGMAGAEDTLFNIEQASKWPRVVITEGPIDAIHAGYHAVCTWGKHITEKQIMKLYKYGVRAVDLMWDGPTAREPQGAINEMFTSLPKLSGLFDTRIVFLPEGDPGDYTRYELAGFQGTALPANSVSLMGVI